MFVLLGINKDTTSTNRWGGTDIVCIFFGAVQWYEEYYLGTIENYQGACCLGVFGHRHTQHKVTPTLTRDMKSHLVAFSLKSCKYMFVCWFLVAVDYLESNIGVEIYLVCIMNV